LALIRPPARGGDGAALRMTSEPTTPRRIVIDAEHFSVRFLVPVLTIVLVVIFHFAAQLALGRLLDDGSSICLVLPLDLLVLVGGGFAIERLLKRAMPSRREAALSDEALVVTDARRQPATVTRIEWGRTVNVAAWRFIIRRRTRVPKGWFCMAVRLLQDDQEAILYTFMSPEEAEAAPGYAQFVRLHSRQETESSTDLGAVAQQRRLLKLEDARWQDGAEIARDDFRALLAVIQQRAATWN
jgi:hypothetical protein